MKAYEFPIILNERGGIDLPPHVKAALEPGSVGKLLLLVEEEEDEDRVWEEMAAQDFFKGYAEEDAIYDNYREQKLKKVRE
jgi:hypothetical protein